MSMVQEPVKQGCRQHRVTEQLTPSAEILVAGQDHAAMFILLGNQAEEQFCFLTVQIENSGEGSYR